MPVLHLSALRTLAVATAFLTLITLSPASISPAHAEDSQQNSGKNSDPVEEDEDDDMMIDSIQQGVQTSVSATARWIDNLFGDGRTFDDDYRSRGRFSLAPEWSEYEGFKLRSSLRAQVNFPIAEERFSAFIGRVDTDDYVVGEGQDRRASVLRNVSGDEEWLVGLGFNPGQGEENRFSITGGVRGGLRADLYTEARYLYQLRLSDTIQIRTRSSLFWRDSDGYGFDQRFDYEQVWGDNWLGRFSLAGTTAERIDGIKWGNVSSIYHLYADDKAIAGEVWFSEETKAPVPVSEYGIRLIHRQSWLRDWFYVEKWIGAHWPKEDPQEIRERAWLVGIEFEVWFGH